MPPAPFAARVGLSCLVLVSSAGFAAATEPAGEWNFNVQLDGKPIGAHRFALTSAGADARQLSSDAHFDVKLLGFTVYRYRHHSDERWHGDCLTAINADTNDDGHVTQVSGEISGDNLTVTSRTTTRPTSATPTSAAASGCVMSFAYWNRQLATQRRLLDPGTGRIENVTIHELPTSTIEVHGQHVAVSGIRIIGLPHPIDVWYADDQWVGLDTSVQGGRKLSYRLP